jgi:hypothetical protein
MFNVKKSKKLSYKYAFLNKWTSSIYLSKKNCHVTKIVCINDMSRKMRQIKNCSSLHWQIKLVKGNLLKKKKKKAR